VQFQSSMGISFPKKPRDTAPHVFWFVLSLINQFRSKKSDSLDFYELLLSWVILSGVCVACATGIVYAWASGRHGSEDNETANELGQAFTVALGLLLTVYLEKSVEKRRRVNVAHHDVKVSSGKLQAIDEEAVPDLYSSLVLGYVLVYSAIVYPLQRLSTGQCLSFPECDPILRVILLNVAFVSSGNLFIFLVAYHLQFKALELYSKSSRSSTVTSVSRETSSLFPV